MTRFKKKKLEKKFVQTQNRSNVMITKNNKHCERLSVVVDFIPWFGKKNLPSRRIELMTFALLARRSNQLS